MTPDPATVRPDRVVDAHVHLWDPARVDWYPYLSGGRDLGIGDVSRMARLFDTTTYFSESSHWNVHKFVHVAAAVDGFTLAETMEREEWGERTGHPAAIVGSIAPADTVADIVASLDAQMAASRFRGVRAPAFEGGVPGPEVLRALQERDLVLDVMTHPQHLPNAARALSAFGDLVVVVEHTGWPTTDSDHERALWSTGMAALAGTGGNVYCKLSGLAMPLGSIDAEVFRPWIEPCLELFGIDRCMFASNFPVDGIHGTFDQLYGAYAALTAGLDAEGRDRLFAANAERVYRC